MFGVTFVPYMIIYLYLFFYANSVCYEQIRMIACLLVSLNLITQLFGYLDWLICQINELLVIWRTDDQTY